MYRTAQEAWSTLDAKRSGLLTKAERYAGLTIAKICLKEEVDSNNTDETHDYQSLGAQGVNHLSNKLMLAMFAPSRPFAKLVAGDKTKADLAKAGVTEVQLDQILADGERKAVKALDEKGQRPVLYLVMRHLIVVGNVLLYLGKENMRAIGLRNYVVQRNIEGQVKQLVVRELIRFDELDTTIQKLLATRYRDEDKVSYYKWSKREDNGSYTMSSWVNGDRLPKEYNGRWPADRFPFLALTWDMADESDYGTGLVEEYAGDLEALSILSEAVVDGAVLGTEYRMLVNPNGITSVDDMKDSENGDYLPGLPNDISPTTGGNPQSIEVAERIMDRYERRVGRGFLMGSAVIRDAERVTTEEVRLAANELETAYGGRYSTLGSSLQKPVAQWLFDAIKLQLGGTDIKVTIVTGLDALSRNGDLENFRLAMSDLATITQVPPDLLARLKLQEIAAFIGQGRNIDLAKFVLNDAEFAEQQQAAQASRVQESAATAGGEAAAQNMAQQGPTQ